MSHRPADRGDDEPFDRLRAADPAAGLSPDGAALDAAVRARVGDDAPTGEGVDEGAGEDRLATARARRRPQRWLAVAAVAAGTLAVGSVGYALGDRAGGDLTATPSGTAPITLSQPGAGGAAPEAASAAGATTEARAASPTLATDSASVSSLGGRTVFSAQGLSDETGTAEAWAYDPTEVFAAETAARVAASLGLAGEPRQEGGTWVVGALDGTGANLQLYPDGTTTVSFYDPARDPFGCPVAQPAPEGEALPEPLPDVAPQDASGDASGGTSAGAPGAGSDPSAPDQPACTTRDLGVAPQGDAAVARAREVIAGTGADPDAFVYEVTDAGTPQASYVTAHELLAGQRTGLLWNVTLVGDGVQSLFGSLAPLVPLGSYDVVSENAAVGRLADPRFGSWGGPVALAEGGAAREAVDPDGPATSGEAPVDVASAPSPVAAGSPFAWPVLEVTLTSARLGLAQYTQPDGAAVLLPAYELSDDDGATWSVVAVADAGLDFTATR